MLDSHLKPAPGIPQQASRSQLFGWYLFDFAGSALVANGGLYFPQWLVIDNHVNDLWYNLTLVASTVLLLVTAPALGYLSDTRLGRLFFLKVTSAALFLSTVTIFLSDRYIHHHVPRVGLALFAFLVVLYSYQLSVVFYNALLGRVANPGEYSKISGRGFAWGWAGAIFGIMAVLPFVRGNVPFIAAGRNQAFLPAAMLFGVLITISLRNLPDDMVQSGCQDRPVNRLYYELITDARLIINSKPLLIFLVSYILFTDAVLTIENNATIYLDRAMHYTETVTAALLVVLLIGAAIGAIGSRRISKIYGLKAVLSTVLMGWVATLAAVVFIHDQLLFAFAFALLGVLFGAMMNTSRVIFMLLIPSQRRGEYFGIYSSFERAASILGPLVWSIPFVILPHGGNGRYRAAMVAMATLIAFSILPLRRLTMPETAQSESLRAEGR